MSQIEQIKAEIERLCSEHSGKYECDEAAIVLDKLYDFVESLEQSIDANKMIGLDEAAEEYAMKGTIAQSVDSYKAFKAGAEWTAEQGVTTEQKVGRTPLNGPNGVTVFLYDFDGFQPGDKVIVQIRKKE